MKDVAERSRPNPEELLRRIEAEESRLRRGRLKVFLGYAPRVGKSYRMLDEGRRRKERGQDVIVASMQTPETPDIQELVSRFEIIPPDDCGGMNVALIVRRRPQVCLVDGLAYDNPPGSRHAQRWQDVEELLEQSIGVVTAVNLQHIAEKQDEVERITGKRARYSVPESFLRKADEIEVVDAPPESLIARDSGADPRPLAQLRELALLLAADVIEHELAEYLDEHGIRLRLGAQERILVAITPRSDAGRMLESGRRNAQRFHGELLAVYVRQAGLTAEDQASVYAHLALAREIGAETHVLDSTRPTEAILEFAREHRITQIFVGHSARSRWQNLVGGSPLDRLIEATEEMDLRIFPHSQAR
jgi:two-component system, OmpR family, sensor histidine kinase KdpD